MVCPLYGLPTGLQRDGQLCPKCRGVGRAELWGVPSSLKSIPGGGGRFGRGCNISYIFGGGGGGPGNPSGYTLVNAC